MFSEQLRSLADDLRIQDGIALGVKKRGNRHTPGALTRNTPVRAAFDCGLDSVLAPIGHPVDVLNCVQRGLPEFIMVNFDEPLVHRSKDDGSLAPPAEGI